MELLFLNQQQQDTNRHGKLWFTTFFCLQQKVLVLLPGHVRNAFSALRESGVCWTSELTKTKNTETKLSLELNFRVRLHQIQEEVIAYFRERRHCEMHVRLDELFVS